MTRDRDFPSLLETELLTGLLIPFYCGLLYSFYLQFSFLKNAGMGLGILITRVLLTRTPISRIAILLSTLDVVYTPLLPLPR